MENLKIITTDIFLEKFDNHTFIKRKDNFLGDIQEKNIYE